MKLTKKYFCVICYDLDEGGTVSFCIIGTGNFTPNPKVGPFGK